MASADRHEDLLRLVRVARALEAGGIYNAAKLVWALAFSEEIHASNALGLPTKPEERDRELEAIVDAVVAAGGKPELVTALQLGLQGAREDRTIPWSDIPGVSVCRTCGEIALGEPPERCPVCGARALSFREFLPVYFLEPLSPEQALIALESAPDEVEGAINGLSEEQMIRPSGPGEWAIRDVLLHLLFAQGLLAARVEKILAEESPSLEGVAAWTLAGEPSIPAYEIVQRYHASRHATVDRLGRLSTRDWWRTAWHNEFGRVTVLQQASYFAKHDRYHLPQIEAIRKAIGA